VFCDTTYLRLIEDLLSNLALEDLRGLCSLQNLVLTKREETLKDELPEGESHEHVLPWEERPVEETRKLLEKTLVRMRISKRAPPSGS
jgi:hypothetical protein